MVVAEVVQVDAVLGVLVVLGEQAGGAHHSQLRPLLGRRAQAFDGGAVLLVGGLRVQVEVLAELPPVRPGGRITGGPDTLTGQAVVISVLPQVAQLMKLSAAWPRQVLK